MCPRFLQMMPLQPNCFVGSDILLSCFIADNKLVQILFLCPLNLPLLALGEEVESSSHSPPDAGDQSGKHFFFFYVFSI